MLIIIGDVQVPTNGLDWIKRSPLCEP